MVVWCDEPIRKFLDEKLKNIEEGSGQDMCSFIIMHVKAGLAFMPRDRVTKADAQVSRKG